MHVERNTKTLRSRGAGERGGSRRTRGAQRQTQTGHERYIESGSGNEEGGGEGGTGDIERHTKTQWT